MTTTERTHTVDRDEFTVTFKLGPDDDLETVDHVSAVLTLADGTRWSATFMTLDAIARVLAERRVTGERLAGRYFQGPDLVIVHAPGIDMMVEVVQRHVEDDHDTIDTTFAPLPT